MRVSQKSTWKQFYSSDYNVSAYMPSLQITYRNNNGIESYWDYTSASAGRAGTGYVNSYTGNLAWIRGDMGFGGNRMPVSISHVYNLNDSANNSFGMGSGWRTNFNQLAYVWKDNTNYYVWEDADGTDHYFKKQSDGSYKDEDGLEMTLTVSGTTKTITDKYGNKSYFNADGLLYKQENNQKTKSSIEISYTPDKKIDYITDGVGRKYDFTYANGLLSSIKYLGSGSDALATTTFTYSGTNLTQVKDTDNKSSTYTYSGNILTSAKDIDGYQLKYSYYTPSAAYQPYRVKTVSEYDGTVAGGTLTMEYAHNQTTLTDYQGNKQILQFNNMGNTVSIQDDEGHAQYSKYAKNEPKDTSKSNQLTFSSKMQNTVASTLQYGSFESGKVWDPYPVGSASVVNTTDQAYHGNRSQLFTMSDTATAWGCIQSEGFTIKAGETYTFSAYVKGVKGTSYLLLVNRTDFSGARKTATVGATDWTRVEVTCANNTGADATYRAQFYADPGSQAYIDCAQVEKTNTASRYNLVENGDFRYATSWSATSGRWGASPIAAPTLQYTAYKLFSNARGTNRIYQTVTVKGSKDDSFVLAGWAMGNSAPLYDAPVGQNQHRFAIHGTFHYTDGTTSKAFEAQFNPDVDNWQYSSAVMVAEKAYSSIKVELVYDYNVNSAYFDGIQLYKEEFGNSYTYDDEGNVTSVVDLQKQTTTYEYTNNDLTEMTLPTGAKLEYTYDSYHNVTKATSEEGQVYEFTYDSWGNNTSVSIVNGTSKITSTATYSTDGNRLLSTTDALGKVTTYDYDANTNVLNWVKYPEDTEATQTNYLYDEDTLRIKEVKATTDTGLAMSANYSYTDDLLTKIQTPSTIYNFEYGDFALRTNVKVGDQTLATYTYADVTNYLTALEYGNGDKVQYNYDKKGRVTQQAYGEMAENPDTGLEEFVADQTVTYTYDNNGALARVKDSATGITTTYYYDFTDRMMKYVESGSGYSHSVGYEYDNINNLSSLVETINGVERKTSYTYDKDNRVETAQTGDTKVTYTYDAFGRVSKQVTTNGTTTVLTETYTYNGNSSQVKTYATTAGGETTTYTYYYDDNGNITSIHDGTYTTTYHYDSANQLIREDNEAEVYTETWSYDSAGNIITQDYCPYTTGDPSSDSNVTYAYDSGQWGDKLASYESLHGSYTVSYDEIGNPLTICDSSEHLDSPECIREYVWQNGRQLASLIDDTTAWDYTYNSDGLRTKRTDGTTTYNYIYNGSQLTGMTVDSHTLYFSYDAAGTPMSVNYDGTEYFYTTNLQGDVTGIVDSSGEAVVTYAYNAWGEAQWSDGTTNETLSTVNPLRYRGYVYDQETGLYYLQSRYYDPELGRFINADNYPTTGQGFTGNNMFAYCGNNPVSRADDGGEFWFTRALVGAVVGAAVSAVVETAKQVAKHITTGKSIDTSAIISSAVGGAVYGGVMVATGSDTIASMASTAATTVTKGIQNGDSTEKIILDTTVNTATTALECTVSIGINKSLSGKYVKLNPLQKFIKEWTDGPYKGRYANGSNNLADSMNGSVRRAGESLFEGIIKGMQGLIAA